jgi:hypothetical protein
VTKGSLIALAITSLIWTSASHAASYNLTSDFSSTTNPNGVWSFVYAGNPLPHQASAQNNGNPQLPAIPAGGYFSTGNNLSANTPDVLQAAVNGSSAGLTNGDFLAGDVLIHSPNDGAAVFVIWTAPTNGTVTFFDSNYWYAHSSVDRSNDIGFIYGSNDLGIVGETSKTSNPNRSAFGQTFNDVDTHFLAGDTIALYFLKSANEEFGSLTGVRMSVEFTPDAVSETPIPGALPLFVSGLAGLGFLAHRRKHRQAASPV